MASIFGFANNLVLASGEFILLKVHSRDFLGENGLFLNLEVGREGGLPALQTSSAYLPSN